MLVSPVLAQDIELDASYTSENGVLTFNYPENWIVEDEGDEINLILGDIEDDSDGVLISFLLLTEEVEENIGVNAEMTAEEAMQAVISGIPEDAGISSDDIVLADYGENITASIDFPFPGEFTIATIVETPSGLVMVRISGAEDTVEAMQELYFSMIATVSINAGEAVIEDDNEDEITEEADTEDEVDEEESIAAELSESFTDKESGLTFSYPDGWDAGAGFGGANLNPDGDDFEDIEDVLFLFLIVDEDAEEQIGINVNMGAEEAMQTIIDSEGDNEVTYDDIVLAEYGDNLVATVELESGGDYVLASIVETSGGIVMVQLMGDEDEVNLIRDIYFDVVASTILSGNSSSSSGNTLLSETYETDNDELSFDYPDDWEIDDEDTSITLSSDDFDSEIEFEFWTEEIEERFGIPEDTKAGDAAIAIASFVEEAGMTAILDKTTIGDYLVASVRFIDPSDDSLLVSAFVQTDDGVILVRLLTTEDEMEELRSIFGAMIESLDYQP